MKVKITRGAGYMEGSVESLLKDIGITQFERTDEGTAFICQMPAATLAGLQNRFFQPHGLTVLEGDPAPEPAAKMYTEAELSRAYEDGIQEGLRRAAPYIAAAMALPVVKISAATIEKEKAKK